MTDTDDRDAVIEAGEMLADLEARHHGALDKIAELADKNRDLAVQLAAARTKAQAVIDWWNDDDPITGGGEAPIVALRAWLAGSTEPEASVDEFAAYGGIEGVYGKPLDTDDLKLTDDA